MSATPTPAPAASNTRIKVLAGVAGLALVGLVVSQFVLGGDDAPTPVGSVGVEADAGTQPADLTELDTTDATEADGGAEPAAVPPVEGPARNVFLPLGEPEETGADAGVPADEAATDAELADPQP